jgi:hypothetical protein
MNASRWSTAVVAVFVLALEASGLLAGEPASGAPAKPENLARKAQASASTAHSDQYQAPFACDGQVPAPGSADDVGKAWVARGNDHPEGVVFTLQWPEPVTIAEVVYYGRTAFAASENWKDFEIRLDDAPAVALKGTLVGGHGPQRMPLAEAAVARKLTIRFTSSWGGPNPGASEIEVYATRPADAALGAFIPANKLLMDGSGPPPPPTVEESAELVRQLKAAQLGFTKLVVAQRHHIRASHVYTYHCEGQRDGGGLFVYDVADHSLTRLVDSPDGQIQACDLSYDGQTIVFGWRRKAEPYQVYTIQVDGTGLRQLTQSDDGHNYDPAWLPDGRIVFLSSRISQAAYCFFTPVGILWTMNADGSDQRRISANYLNDFTPAVMNDGRIIYGRWEYVDRPAIPIQSLWTIQADGSMLQGFFGNRVLDPASFIEPQPIPGSRAVLCTLTGHNGSCRGAIGIIDPSLGNNAQAGIRNITPEIRLRGIAHSTNGPRGPYQTPYPLDQRYYLVSYDGTLLVRDYDCTEQATVLEPQEGMGFYNPRPLRSRPRPPVRSSQLAGDGGAASMATLYLQDVYNGLEPHVERGEVKQIAVVQEVTRALISSPGIHQPLYDFQRMLVSCGATYVPKKVLGFADVAEDGSACFRVPPMQPLYFIALDAHGRAVQRMRSFTHLMPGEVQGCIGCHESRHDGPRPLLPSVLAREPQDLAPPEWGVRGFCYATLVQPVLDQHCVGCHNAHEAHRPDLAGDRTDCFNVSYEMLADVGQGRTGSPYVNWIPTYNGHEWNIQEITPKKWGSHPSKLAGLVLAGHPDEDGQPRVRLSEPERRRILMWIDLNVPYYGTADTAHPDLPGCRQMYPAELPNVMNDVFARRCAECHQPQQPSMAKSWTPRTSRWRGDTLGLRIERPELNAFLLAPLPASAGGTGKCGQAVFASTSDADYQAVLKTFEPIQELARQTPRMDMPGAVPAPVCFDCRRADEAEPPPSAP